ncbi:hypothetical protein N0V95_007787 [Ascochyta clinopodiicola]|nr:hypothetical protein N0V95_007787 [Ascochyta clinopodiicola]
MALSSILASETFKTFSEFFYWKLFILAGIPLAAVYYLYTIKPPRIDLAQYSHFPQPEPADPVRGHWPWIEKAAAAGDSRRAFDEMLYEQAEKLGFPPVLLVDWRPVEKFPILFILDHDVAEQVTRSSKMFPTSLPKHPAIQHLAPLVGARSLVTTDGDEWKALRKRILPGFAPQHLLSLVDVILDKTSTFIELMEEKAVTGETFRLDSYTTNLVFDIIGIVTFDMDLNAQIEGSQSDVLLTYRALSQAFNKRPFGGVGLRDYFTTNEREIRRLDKKLDGILKTEIVKQHRRLLAGDSTPSKSVATLSLAGITNLTPQILQQTSDTLRGFLFAGHDTTSILLQWAFYELHTHPQTLHTLCAELTRVLGPATSPSDIATRLRAPDAGVLLANLPFTDAVLKETLRLHPPGTTARVAPVGSNTTLTLPGGEVLGVDGLCVSPRSYTIQRHPSIFGADRDEFRPQRWLADADADAEAEACKTKIPDSAFRPYERGPRRCTGAALAQLEAKIVLVCVVRWAEFVKVGLGEVVVGGGDEKVQGEEKEMGEEKGEKELKLHNNGQVSTRGKLFSTHQVTAKPVDGMLVRVRIRDVQEKESVV